MAAGVTDRLWSLEELVEQTSKLGLAMVNEARLREVLNQAAIAIEGLYAELKRIPPSEGYGLIKELRQFANELSN
jgi:hypothetical protein